MSSAVWQDYHARRHAPHDPVLWQSTNLSSLDELSFGLALAVIHEQWKLRHAVAVSAQHQRYPERRAPGERALGG